MPARDPNVLAVGATDPNDTKYGYSNYGAGLDVMAPSSTLDGLVNGIVTLDLTGAAGDNSTDYYPNFGATSAACPEVAALAGLVLSQDPNLTRDQVYLRIEGTAVDCGDPCYDESYGWGRIDAAAALRPPTTQGTIAGREVWVGATVTLTGNVTVASGASLTFGPGTLTYVARNISRRTGPHRLF